MDQFNKFSTPNTKTLHGHGKPPTLDSLGSHKFSLLNLLHSSQTDVDAKKHSLHLTKTRPFKDQNIIMEDRYIPSRRLIQDCCLGQNVPFKFRNAEQDPQALNVADLYSEEILGKSTIGDQNAENQIDSFKNKNILRYRDDSQSPTRRPELLPTPINEISSPITRGRKIPKHPERVLDAPSLTDDFYLNLTDWSNQNLLAVGLGNSTYIWNAETSQVKKLHDLSNDLVTSVCWSPNDPYLCIGCNKGDALIWDINQEKQIRRLHGHESRIGAMSWGNKFLATGSKDQNILFRDPNSSKHYVQVLSDHTQQICGMKWSCDNQYLATGGNDNKVVIWNDNGQPINRFTDHNAAVKAIAWSPHQHGLLATGGGTADRYIKLRNVFDGEIIKSVDTGSQVCNLYFSKSLSELVSTHGYSHNELNVWLCPSMRKIASLRGHTHRVLYLAASPDGSTIVTGAGDETLRFWKIFPSIYEKQVRNESKLDMGFNFR